MKKFINKVQDLGKKAAEIKQSVQGMPAKAAELRQAVVMSAAELQQIRSDVQTNLSGLRASSEDRVLEAMRDINDNTYTFEEAGYELTGMDLDLAITQRLTVQFQKFEDVPLSTLRHLLSSATNDTVKCILSGLIKAEETAANIELTHLKYDGVTIDVGAVPLIRMLWRSDTFIEQQTVETAPASIPSPSPVQCPPTSPAFGSFFEQRTIPISTAAPASATLKPDQSTQSDSASAGTTSTTPSVTATPAKPASKGNALDRFKKMPDLTKSRY